MPIVLTLRGSNTDDVATAPKEVSIYCLGITPKRRQIGEATKYANADLKNGTGSRWLYAVEPYDFSVEAATGTAEQDQGDLNRLEDLLLHSKFIYLYSVTGSSRVDENGDPFWPNHGLPVAVVRVGDPLAAEAFDDGAVRYSFELERKGVTLS